MTTVVNLNKEVSVYKDNKLLGILIPCEYYPGKYNIKVGGYLNVFLPYEKAFSYLLKYSHLQILYRVANLYN